MRAACAALLLCSAASTAGGALPAYADASQPVLARVASLLPLLSQQQKLHQLLRGAAFNASTTPATGIGLLEMGGIFAGAASPGQAAAQRNAAQAAALAAGPGAAFGVPLSFRTLATHGGEAFGTIFPQGPGLGAAFDVDLARRVAAATAASNRALGIDLVTFVIHMVADARFGRQMEGFSEEPMLTGALGAASVAGAQGALGIPPDAYILPPSAPALFKHLGAYGAPAGGLNGMRADVTEYTLRDQLMRPWRAVAAAGSRGVMPSHNSVLNCPAHANQALLTGLVRGELNQSLALVLSDTGDVAALAGFGLCGSDAECGALALTAGVDVEQPPGTTFLALPAAMAAGLASAADLDAAVARVLVHKFSSGLFDAPLVNASAADEIVNCAEHRALAREAARAAAVLLKNDGRALPLRQGARLAVLGPLGGCGSAWSSSSSGGGGGGSGGRQGASASAPLCEAQAALLGNYAGTAQLPLTGVPALADALVASGLPSHVTFARGANVEDSDGSLLAAAVAAARQPGLDAVIVALGDSPATCGESIDRSSLDLPGGQLMLLGALAAANLTAPIVLVLFNGRSVTFGPGNAALAPLAALLVAWKPGQEGGAAVGDLLFGVAAPAGRLPHSWVRAAGQAGGSASPWLQERAAAGAASAAAGGAEGRRYGSYWAERPDGQQPATPLFSFGEGMSYTTFALSSPSVAVQLPGNASFPLAARVTVTNAGASHAGVATVLAFVQDPRGAGAGRVVRPWKRLVAFARSPLLAPGASAQLLLPVAHDDLAFHSANFTRALQRGSYVLSLGQSSLDDAANVLPFEL
jgi:beta-glucosidase